MSIHPIRQYATQEWDMATIGHLATCVMALREIPASDLLKLCHEDSSAYLTLYGAHKAIEEKLLQMSVHL